MTRDVGRTQEPAQVPPDAVILGWGPVVPFPAAAIWLWLGGPKMLVGAMQIWAASLVIFLSGVRRGLSFRMPGSWTWAQFAMFAVLFCIGLAASTLPDAAALALLALVFLGLAVLDPASAARAETPLWFRRLRPGQMTLAAIGLGGISLHA